MNFTKLPPDWRSTDLAEQISTIHEFGEKTPHITPEELNSIKFYVERVAKCTVTDDDYLSVLDESMNIILDDPEISYVGKILYIRQLLRRGVKVHRTPGFYDFIQHVHELTKESHEIYRERVYQQNLGDN